MNEDNKDHLYQIKKSRYYLCFHYFYTYNSITQIQDNGLLKKERCTHRIEKMKLFHANCSGTYVYQLSSGNHLYRTVPTSLLLKIRISSKDGTVPIRASVA